MDETGIGYIKWNKSDIKRQTSYVLRHGSKQKNKNWCELGIVITIGNLLLHIIMVGKGWGNSCTGRLDNGCQNTVRYMQYVGWLEFTKKYYILYKELEELSC